MKRGLAVKRLSNPFQLISDIIHSVSCIVNDFNKIVDGIDSGDI